MRRAAVDCECCGKTDLDADDIRKYEGYLVCVRCRIVHADELTDRRAHDDELVRALLETARVELF